jgi:hypothetical protein
MLVSFTFLSLYLQLDYQICGGFPYAAVESARIILANSKTSVFSVLVKLYQLTLNKYIESLEWVDKCIDRQDVIFTPHVFKNPGGRRAGEEYVYFSEMYQVLELSFRRTSFNEDDK